MMIKKLLSLIVTLLVISLSSGNLFGQRSYFDYEISPAYCLNGEEVIFEIILLNVQPGSDIVEKTYLTTGGTIITLGQKDEIIPGPCPFEADTFSMRLEIYPGNAAQAQSSSARHNYTVCNQGFDNKTIFIEKAQGGFDPWPFLPGECIEFNTYFDEHLKKQIYAPAFYVIPAINVKVFDHGVY